MTSWISTITLNDIFCLIGLALYTLVLRAIVVWLILMPYAASEPRRFDMSNVSARENFQMYLKHHKRSDKKGDMARTWRSRANKKLGTTVVQRMLDDCKKGYA